MVKGIGVCYFCGVIITKRNDNNKGYIDCCNNPNCIRREEMYFKGCYK